MQLHGLAWRRRSIGRPHWPRERMARPKCGRMRHWRDRHAAS
jgi:hypothetical protein